MIKILPLLTVGGLWARCLNSGVRDAVGAYYGEFAGQSCNGDEGPMAQVVGGFVSESCCVHVIYCQRCAPWQVVAVVSLWGTGSNE